VGPRRAGAPWPRFADKQLGWLAAESGQTGAAGHCLALLGLLGRPGDEARHHLGRRSGPDAPVGLGPEFAALNVAAVAGKAAILCVAGYGASEHGRLGRGRPSGAAGALGGPLSGGQRRGEVRAGSESESDRERGPQQPEASERAAEGRAFALGLEEPLSSSLGPS